MPSRSAKATTDAAGAFSMTASRRPSTSAGCTTSTPSSTGSGGEGWAPDRPQRDDEPEGGTVGTPITIKVVGLGAPTYESLGAVLYDNKYRGPSPGTDAVAPLSSSCGPPVTRAPLDRASATPATTVPYLNLEQSPIPGLPVPDEVHGHQGRGELAPTTSGPSKVKPTIDARTTLGGEPRRRD